MDWNLPGNNFSMIMVISHGQEALDGKNIHPVHRSTGMPSWIFLNMQVMISELDLQVEQMVMMMVVTEKDYTLMMSTCGMLPIMMFQ